MSNKEKFNAMVKDAKAKAERQEALLDAIDGNTYEPFKHVHGESPINQFEGALGAFPIFLN